MAFPGIPVDCHYLRVIIFTVCQSNSTAPNALALPRPFPAGNTKKKKNKIQHNACGKECKSEVPWSQQEGEIDCEGAFLCEESAAMFTRVHAMLMHTDCSVCRSALRYFPSQAGAPLGVVCDPLEPANWFQLSLLLSFPNFVHCSISFWCV